MKIQKHIEIVRSDTPKLSSMGNKSAAMIQRLLSEYYERVEISTVSTLYDLTALVAKRPDLVVLGVKQIPTEDGILWVSAYLEAHGINHLGSQTAAIELDYDKPSSKAVVRSAGILTADSFVAYPGSMPEADMPLAYPIFVKPPNGGGGKGIDADSVVRNYREYSLKVLHIYDKFGSPSLVETYLPGREFSVALMENEYTDAVLAMPLELIVAANGRGDRMLSESVKEQDTEQVVPVVDAALRMRINRLAKAAYRALGARDYGRVDIRLDIHGVPHFLEANLIPGLAKNDFTSYFIRACEINKNMEYDAIILHLVHLALHRYAAPKLEKRSVALI